MMAGVERRSGAHLPRVTWPLWTLPGPGGFFIGWTPCRAKLLLIVATNGTRVQYFSETGQSYNIRMARRPKQPPGEARGNVLRIRLTTQERQAIDAAARAAGLESATWARAKLLALAAAAVPASKRNR
jgi:hypothetical protein